MELVFVGDIMFDWKIRKIIQTKDPAYPLQNLSLPLTRDGLIIGNLETVLSDRILKSIKLKNDKIISPVVALQSLKKAGITCLSLANNHVFDYGTEGLTDTINNLRNNGFLYFGAGMNHAEAHAICQVNHRGKKIGVLSRTFTCEAANSSFSTEEPQAAELNYHALTDCIKNKRHFYDFLIVILHFGFEYCFYPNSEDVKFCRELIDHGADLIVGHHPHVFQGIEKYKHGLIAYSLGNFLFDISDEPFPDTSSGLILKVQLTECVNHSLNIKDYSVEPVLINKNGIIEIPSPDIAKEITYNLNLRSSKLLLPEHEYKYFADGQNAKTVIGIRKKEVIKYLKKGNFIYLFKKLSNLRLIHIRLLIQYIKKRLKKGTSL